MEEHLQQIRAALEAGASTEARRTGVLACQTLLSVLEAAPVQHEPSNVASPAASTGSAGAPAAPVASMPDVLPELCDPREVPPAVGAVPPAVGAVPSAVGAVPPTVGEVPPAVGAVPFADASSSVPSPSPPSLPATPPPTPAVPSAGGGIDPAALAAIVTTIRSLSPDQWLDLIIHKLQTAVRSMPAAPAMPMMPAAPVAFPQAAPQPLRFQFVTVPPRPMAPARKGKSHG